MSVKLLKPIFLVSTILCVLFRIYLTCMGLDPKTGFYSLPALQSTVFSVLLLLGVVLLLAGGFFKKLPPDRLFLLRATPFLRISCFLAGAGAILCCIEATQRLLADFNLGDYETKLLLSLSRVLGTGLSFLTQSLAPLVVGFLLFYIGGRARGNLAVLALNPYLLLVPVIWQIALVLKTFLDYTAVRFVSDQRLMVTSMVFAVPFFIAFGRMVSKTGSTQGMRQMRTYAFPFALLSLTTGAGLLAAKLTGNVVEVGPSFSLTICYFAFGLLAAACMFSVFDRPLPLEERTPAPPDEAEKAESTEK